MKQTYKSLLKEAPESDAVQQIERDLGRTFPRDPYFMEKAGGKGSRKLKRVLTAFSIYRKDICYVQGMNFIVA